MNKNFRSRSGSDSKRRREIEEKEEEGKEVIKKGKITRRTPPKQFKENKQSTDKEMDGIKELIEKLSRDLKAEMKINMEELREHINQNNLFIIKMQQEMQEKEEKWEKEKQQIYQKIKNLEEKIEAKDIRGRRNNIVIKGLQPREKEQDLKGAVEIFLKEELKLEPQINKAIKITTKDHKTIVIAEMNEWKDKIDVMKNKNKLGNKRIYIENDLTKEERKIQSEIRKLARDRKEKGERV